MKKLSFMTLVLAIFIFACGLGQANAQTKFSTKFNISGDGETTTTCGNRTLTTVTKNGQSKHTLRINRSVIYEWLNEDMSWGNKAAKAELAGFWKSENDNHFYNFKSDGTGSCSAIVSDIVQNFTYTTDGEILFLNMTGFVNLSTKEKTDANGGNPVMITYSIKGDRLTFIDHKATFIRK